MENHYEHKNRPIDSDFRQQRLKSLQIIMTPTWIILIFLAVGIAFVPSGVQLIKQSNDIYMETIEYDGPSQDIDCSITNQPSRRCMAQFNITKDVTGPIYVYYQLTNFFQNHRAYVSSRCAEQLMGESNDGCSNYCTSADKVGNLTLNPCGLIANSFFTDTYNLSSTKSKPTGLYLDESDISWESDEDKFKQPNGFLFKEIKYKNVTCAKSDLPDDCDFYEDPQTGQLYNFYYPDNQGTQYLYETYEGIISPIFGVTDEHFKVWMRPAALPKFRKLYGKIEGDFKKGDVLMFEITARFEVNSFDGTKSLVISTTGEFGGQNPYLGLSYIVVGSISLLFALLFITKQLIAPRPVADPSSLNWT